MGEVMPSEESRDQGWFDQFATKVDHMVSSSVWFTLSLASVLLWAIWGPFAKFSEGWQLVINTGTTILTFLLVGLAANASSRNTKAINLKLNAIADALADLMENSDEEDRRKDAAELRRSVGIEHEAST